MVYFDASQGLLDRRVFGSSEVYTSELNGIFRRCWLFIAPSAWVEAPGQLYVGSMGEDSVLLWRGADRVLRGFLNQCAASNRPLCASGRGQAPSLVCACHGWSYTSQGEGPGGRRLYPVPRLCSYRELVFASLAESGALLSDQLGDFGWYMDLLLDQPVGGAEFYGGAEVRSTLQSNWKLSVEAFCGDTYRENTVHSATNVALGYREPLRPSDGFQALTGGGAMAFLEQTYTSAPDCAAQEASLTPFIGAMFPNLTFDWRTRSLHLWSPKSSSRTEVATYCIVGQGDPPNSKDGALRRVQLEYGPGGMRMQDLEGPWRSITASAGGHSAREAPFNFQMGLGQDIKRNLPGQIGSLVSELGQRGFYTWWEKQLALTGAPAPGLTLQISRRLDHA